MKLYEAEVRSESGLWVDKGPVVLLTDLKEEYAYFSVEAERALFETNNKVPNGVFWAGDYYNFTKGTDQTTWMMFNNKWYGWIECVKARSEAANKLGEK